jgi:hypothetical protein
MKYAVVLLLASLSGNGLMAAEPLSIEWCEVDGETLRELRRSLDDHGPLGESRDRR